MNITFERFTEKYIAEAKELAYRELEEERKYNSELPKGKFEKEILDILRRLSGQPYGKAAVCDGKLVGYLLFSGPWNGFLGNIKGVFSPLGGSAFSYEYSDRGKLASMLFAGVSEEFVKDGVTGCALSRYAHDEEIAKSFIFNGFGIRCSDAVRKIPKEEIPGAAGNISLKELNREEFQEVEQLQRGLHKHLENAPVFFPPDKNGFECWFEKWIKRETMRIFAAKAEEETIGFFAIDDEAENFITEYEQMKNICGAYFDEKYRGSGAPQALLSYVLNTMREEGITYLGVDCETLNPTALRFWGKYFMPYTYSFARRIDERVCK